MPSSGNQRIRTDRRRRVYSIQVSRGTVLPTFALGEDSNQPTHLHIRNRICAIRFNKFGCLAIHRVQGNDSD